MELFQERGYDDTTAAAIAARAGVTERTFFRHFRDKRDVLFDGEEAFRDALSRGVAAAPVGLDALGAVLFACREMEAVLERNRPFSGPRQAVISRSPALQERNLAKTAILIDGLDRALQRRGVGGGAALLAAQVGMAVFSRALQSWFDQPGTTLGAHLTAAAEELRRLSQSVG